MMAVVRMTMTRLKKLMALSSPENKSFMVMKMSTSA